LPMVLPMYDALNESHHGGVDSHEPSKFFGRDPAPFLENA